MKDWIQPYLRMYKGRIILSLLFGILGIGSGAMLLFISGYLISKSALQPVNIMIVYVPIVAVRAFSIGQAAFLYVEKLISHDIVLRILEKMRTKLYHVVEPQALFLKSRYQTGDLLGVVSEDIEHLQDLYIRTIFPGLVGVLIYSAIIGVLGYFDLVFAIMMALTLGIILFLIPFLSFFIARKNHARLKQQRNKLYQLFTDAIFGLTDWKASGRADEFLSEALKQDESLIETERKIQKWHYIRDALLQLVVGISIIAMLIWSGIQADQEMIAPTVIAAFTLMIFSITDALVPVSDAIEHIPSYHDSIHRITAIEHHDFPEEKMEQSDWSMQDKTEISIDHLNYQYPDSSAPVLKDISIHIAHGKKLAVLGRSGAGKSTLLKLLAGAIEPDQGSIKINDQKMHSGLLSQAVAVLNQKPHLFSTSIANNIRVGRPDATDEEVRLAAEQAQLTSLIDSLPEGIDTQMREMGNRFSGGERQRIAFARVLLQNTPIVLVDEATIGLDPQTERDLLDTMLEAMKDKTVIWITHHLASVEDMDEILFLDDGNISMQGSHKTLLETEEHYRRLYEMDQSLPIANH